MILGVPVVDGHELTQNLIDTLQLVTVPENFRLVIVDNNSDTPYVRKNFGDSKFPIDVFHNKLNTGYYFPLLELAKVYPKEEYIGLIHNDMVLYTQNWNEVMEQCFKNDPKLGLIGLCGSSEIDERGGRGGGTMCFFRGAQVHIGNGQYLQGQSQAAGLRITDLRPSLILDSLFMMFRASVIPSLNIDWDITLAHFYDRIWPIRTIEAGFRVATLGIECDHLGGMTCTANERYRDDCIKWLTQRGIDFDNPETEMYLVAERRYLSEYREEKHFLPAVIGMDYGIRRI
jgi:hypothetical protein